MTLKPWPTNNWPAGVPREISGYEKPVFSLLDETAAKYPDNVYTIFNDGERTFAQGEGYSGSGGEFPGFKRD